MNAMIGSCGLDCVKCPAYVATARNDDALRAKTASEWSKMFGADIRPEHINCEGCHAKSGVQIAHCSVCEIRLCAAGKKFENCAPCADFPCGKLDFIFKADAEAKARLNGMRPGTKKKRNAPKRAPRRGKA